MTDVHVAAVDELPYTCGVFDDVRPDSHGQLVLEHIVAAVMLWWAILGLKC
jgi:hypothetical protein